MNPILACHVCSPGCSVSAWFVAPEVLAGVLWTQAIWRTGELVIAHQVREVRDSLDLAGVGG